MLNARHDRDDVSAVSGPQPAANHSGRAVTTPPYKILFYVPSLGDGGGERLWAALASAFHRAGHTVIFAQDFDSDDSRHILDPDIPVFTVGHAHSFAVRNLARVLKKQRPDVALSAIAGSNLKLIAARLLSGTQTKIIQTFHGHHEWKSGRLSYATARSLPLTSRMSARTIAVSEPLREDLVKTWRSTSDKTVFVANPVFLPSPITKPTLNQLNARAPIILAVGRLSPDKDYATLIKAFARLKRKDAQLILLGKGPEENTIMGLVDTLGIKTRVSLEGYVTEPWPYFERAKCLALSSKTESFGNVLVEALAHGLPIVATDTDGPKHILTSPELGTRVPVGDVDAMASALDQHLEAPGDPAPRFARAAEFSMKQRFPAYEALIAEVLGKSSSSSDGRKTPSEN